MSKEEIIAAVNETFDSLAGTTVNERLYLTGLWDEFDEAKKSDKEKAGFILQLLKVDEDSIKMILKQNI